MAGSPTREGHPPPKNSLIIGAQLSVQVSGIPVKHPSEQQSSQIDSKREVHCMAVIPVPLGGMTGVPDPVESWAGTHSLSVSKLG